MGLTFFTKQKAMTKFSTKNSTLKHLSFLFAMCLSIGLFAQPAFTDVTVAKGITEPLNNLLPFEHDGHEFFDMMGVGSGAAWLDFNGDGNMDLYITMRDASNRLYENNGPPNYDFTEVAATYNLEDAAGDGSGVGVADFDNDGDPDIYVCNTNEDRLYRNDGNTFTDITVASDIGLSNDSRSTSASWGDYDQDGYLDLYVSRHMPHPTNSTNATRQDQLYHNDGDGTFTDVSELLDESLLFGPGFIGGFVDYDNDSDMDIIVINDCAFTQEEGRTRIFRNDGGTDGVTDWDFAEVAASVGVDDCSNGMGIAVGDVNHDGYQEFANSDIGPINFWKNDNGSFSDITSAAGVGDQNAADYSWGINLFDYNNDGWLDMFLVSGSLNFLENIDPQPNYFYENTGTTGEVFTDKSEILDMDDAMRSRNSLLADYDNDGDLDVFILNYGAAVALRQNNNTTNNWLKVKLTGMFAQEGAGYSNSDGVGAKIEVTTFDGITQTVETRSGSSLGGGEQVIAHFGLGANSVIEELKITWPCGNVQTLENITDINTTMDISESPDAPLAVDLISFEVKPFNQQAILEWQTASETDNDFFLIERSTDGRNFESIGTVEGHGTTTALSSYIFIDKTPKTGDNYYRLEQTDFDGRTSYSSIRLASFGSQISKLEVVPNPVSNGQFKVSFNTADKEVVLELIDIFGKVIKREDLTHDGVESHMQFNIEDLPSGMYMLRLSGTSTQEIAKVMVR